MKEYSTDKIRNIALVGHSGAGKTAIAEAALFATKALTRMGKTEEGNTVSDFEEEEIRRGVSISTSLIPVEHSGFKFNLLDTPGYADFVGEMIGGLYAADYGVVVLDSVAGVEVGTEIAWQYLDEHKIPRMVVINRMNRDNANWTRVLDQLEEAFPDERFVPLQLPLGKAEDFKGIYRLNSATCSIGPDDKDGDVPSDVDSEAESRREALVEAAAESDDKLIEKYFDEGTLSPDEVRNGLHKGAREGSYVPVLLTAADECLGIHAFLDSLKYLAPAPHEARKRPATRPGSDEEVELSGDGAGSLAAAVWKTQADPYVGRLQYLRVYSGRFSADSRAHNANADEEERIGPIYVLRGKEQISVGHISVGDIGAVAKLQHTQTGHTLCDKDDPVEIAPADTPQPLYSVALSPVAQADGAKMGQAIQKIVEEDPTLVYHYEEATKEPVLSGMGDSHIDVAIRNLKEKYSVNLNARVPRVPYRETISQNGTAQYRHKKQSGGAGQFAEVHLRVEPMDRGEGFEFGSEIFGGAISSQYVSSIEKGVRQVLPDGVIANCPVVDVKAIVYDGKEHPVDSKDIAFQIAARQAFRQAVKDAGPVLLEPVYMVRIIVPNAQMGDVLGDINTRRGMVQGTEQIGGRAVVSAHVPLAEIQRYATDLRSMTQGRGYYTIDFDHFARVPHQAAEAVIAAANKADEED